MSKLTKILSGVVVATVLVVGFSVFVSKAKAATFRMTAAEMQNLSTVKVGSTSSAVLMWQKFLNDANNAGLTEDSKFGSVQTLPAVKTWQADRGLVADGIPGALSRAAAAAQITSGGVVTPEQGNCPAGYTAITPVAPLFTACQAATVVVPASTCGAGYTAVAVPVAPLFAACEVSTVVVIGTNGYLTDISSDSTNRVSTVYESETDKVVAGFRATARLSDQKIDRVRVTFLNTNTTASANLGKYIASATLWMGSTKLATIPVSEADRATATDTYTFNFSGLNANLAKDQIGRFYVSVAANGSLDTTDTTNANWTVRFIASGVSVTSPDGRYDTYPSADIIQTGLLFGKFSASGVKSELTLSTGNPSSVAVAVNANTATNNVELLKFKIKAVNSNLILRKIPIQITLAPQAVGDDVVDVINTVKLMQGTNVVDTLDGSAGFQFTAGAASNFAGTACTNSGNTAGDFCSFQFSNLSTPYNTITASSTAEYSVVVDFKSQANYTVGATVTAAFVNPDALLAANYSVQDTNGDQLTNASSTVRVGSAVGNVMTLLVNGINVTQGAANITKISDNAGIITSVTYDIPLTLTAFGQTLYVGQAVELAAAASGATTTAKAFSFALQDSAAPAVNIVAAPAATAVTTTLSSSDALIETNGFRLDSGSPKHFTMQAILSCTAAACAGATTANYRVNSLTVRSAVDGALTAPANQTLVPAQSYQTLYQKIM